jgi:hypothetical protein
MGAAATAPTRVRWNFQQTADLASDPRRPSCDEFTPRRSREPRRVVNTSPAPIQAEADGNDDGNDGNQSRPQARSGNHPRAGNAAGPGQLSHLKIGRSRPLASPAGPEAVQRASTATPPTANDSIGLRPTTDQRQRSRTTSPPRVRIEGVNRFDWSASPLNSELIDQSDPCRIRAEIWIPRRLRPSSGTVCPAVYKTATLRLSLPTPSSLPGRRPLRPGTACGRPPGGRA